MKYFIPTKNGSGNNWPVCWTGQDDEGAHCGVSTFDVRASQLHKISRGAYGDAELIAKLLNWYYSNPDGAENVISEDMPAPSDERPIERNEK